MREQLACMQNTFYNIALNGTVLSNIKINGIRCTFIWRKFNFYLTDINAKETISSVLTVLFCGKYNGQTTLMIVSLRLVLKKLVLQATFCFLNYGFLRSDTFLYSYPSIIHSYIRACHQPSSSLHPELCLSNMKVNVQNVL